VHLIGARTGRERPHVMRKLRSRLKKEKNHMLLYFAKQHVGAATGAGQKLEFGGQAAVGWLGVHSDF
jgi:hypothetical protein